ITVGASTAEGSSVTVTLSGTKSDGSTATATYTYKKTAPKQYPTLDGGGFVFDNSSKNWSTVNAYVYDESGSSVVSNASWPGLKMTDCGNGYWKYELDSKFANSSSVKVIFNNGSEQIPAAQQPGFDMKASDKKLYEDGTWKDLPAVSSLKATLSASPSSVVAGNPVTLTASSTGGSGTVSYEFKQGSTTIQASSTKTSCTWTPSTSGSYTITVTAKDSSGNTATATTTVNVTAPVTTDPVVNVNKATGTTFTTETLDVTLTLSNAVSGTYSVDNGPEKTFTGSKTVTLGQGKIGDSTVTLKTTATNSAGTTKTYTFTYEKDYVVKTTSSSATLASQYAINANGKGKNKTITVDGDVSEWDSSMLIAQGAANDDPRVYRPNSMYEIPYDAYAMYGAWDDTNLYLMIEMTNVQDVVAPNDNYPLSSNATVDNIPMFIYIDTGKSDAIGNNGLTQKGTSLWGCQTTVTNSFNRVIALSSGVGKNGPYIYSGDSTGINPVEIGNAQTSGITYKSGKGIASSKVIGINGGYGEYNNRVLGDMCSDSSAWVDFNTLNHNSSSMDYNYEISIPLSILGITKSDIESNGVGVLFVHSSGASGMDCLPYDLTMNDSADQSDPQSNPENSLEKSDADNITTSFARIGNGGVIPPQPTTPLQVNFGTDRSAPQLTTTALTLKAVGYGGTAPYKYQFYVDNTSVKSNSTTDSCSWTPTVGTHTIKCVITDSTGATATVSKTFTAETSGSVTELENSSTLS
ncbi:MAG: starch-binding protein, partial [Acutalibacteraceae bacterium]